MKDELQIQQVSTAITPITHEKMPKVEIWNRITREDVRANRGKTFLFGDNLAERGFGGQAKEMRGEMNSIGIPTKKAPSNSQNSFFTDKEYLANIKAIDEAFSRIPADSTIVIPKSGLGTGLARLSEKAPQTFSYLNGKLAGIGFDNLTRTPILTIPPDLIAEENKTIAVLNQEKTPTAKRLLDLNHINTPNLKLLAPGESEIEALKADRVNALAAYADRLRSAYRDNTENFRAGLKLLSDSLEKGEQITIVCSCRQGAMCHSDVVKLAVEKVNTHWKEQNKTEKHLNLQLSQENSRPIERTQLNPRTQKAINEILSFSDNDRLLTQINQTEGRNRSEQASYLAQRSQFIRDFYERGANVADGNLIIPQEKLKSYPPQTITTQEYAVNRLAKILPDEYRAKEIAPVVVEYANQIAGATSDGETKLKIFNWIYESLEGKSGLIDQNDEIRPAKTFNETLSEISQIAGEMRSLEPHDQIDFVPLEGFEPNEFQETDLAASKDNLELNEIYEDALGRDLEFDRDDYLQNTGDSSGREIRETFGFETYERIDLNAQIPQIPFDFTEKEVKSLLTKTLPAIDLQLENGVSVKEILAPFYETVRQSASDNTLDQLERIYQKQKINPGFGDRFSSAKSAVLSDSVQSQLKQIDPSRQNIIELKHPSEFRNAEKESVSQFFKLRKHEIGSLLTKIDEVNEKDERNTLKKALTQITKSTPNFAFKLQTSEKIVVGSPSPESIQSLNFVSSYVEYQLRQPESRLRFENQRYRVYAAKLESAATRDDVMKTAAEIRAENAQLGFSWKDLPKTEQDKTPRPLTNREMQFLFTESSPAHYTNEMTAVRISFAHSGASRRAMVRSLTKGEIVPSPEAQKLIESLESRLRRRRPTDSLIATKHFFESIKVSNDHLKYKNDFDHREFYQKLPSQEKDFVYQKATWQKENLEYQLAFKNEQLKQNEFSNVAEKTPETSQTEKRFHLLSSFYQARKIAESRQSNNPIKSQISDIELKTVLILLNNQPPEKVAAIGKEIHKSENLEYQKIGEILQTFAHAEITSDEKQTTYKIKLPENRLINIETYQELLKTYPNDERDNEKYKFKSFNDQEINRTLKNGQDEAIIHLKEEHQLIVSDPLIEKLDEIKKFQTEARLVRRENEVLVAKYVSRANNKSKWQNKELPIPITQKEIVKLALGKTSVNVSSNKTNDRFLKIVRNEITISDFKKYVDNEKFLGELKFKIKNDFAEITLLNESKSQTTQIIENPETEKINSTDFAKQEIVEKAPLSLRIFKKEFEKAEQQLLRDVLNERLSVNEKHGDPLTIISKEERDQIKLKALEVTKEILEPKELDALNRKVSGEVSRQAFFTYKQLERASNIFLNKTDQKQINQAFLQLDREAANLNELRQNYDRNERISLLKNGIKTDLMDLFKKNGENFNNSLETQINKILLNNLNNGDFSKKAANSNQVNELSRQIYKEIEEKQILVSYDKTVINTSLTENELNKTKIYDKMKESPVLSR